MDAEIVVLRLLHIVPGVVWVGTAIFTAWVMSPAIAKAGPPHSAVVMKIMVKPMIILLHSSALLTIVFGVIMAFRVRPNGLFDVLWSTPWGTMIWLGALLAVVGYAIGTFGGLKMKKMMAIGESLQGPPLPEQGAEMAALRSSAAMMTKVASVIVLIAVVCMALAQHV